MPGSDSRMNEATPSQTQQVRRNGCTNHDAQNLEAAEKKYRDTPIGNKKRAKRLTDFIELLILNGKILEAKHHFKSLYEKNPNHAKTIRLGYSISIATFDNEGVREFDKLLCESKPKDIEIYWFRLKYYLSVNNYKGCEDCCALLLSKSTKKEYLKTTIEACLNLKSYTIASRLIEYLEKENLALNSIGNRQLTNIVLEKLVNSIAKVKCV